MEPRIKKLEENIKAAHAAMNRKQATKELG
jgi:hypothetical protein